MNNYISMVKNDISNVALATFSGMGQGFSAVHEASAALGRFGRMAEQTGEDSYLGIQLNLDYGTSSMAYLFAKAGIEITQQDYEWAFEEVQCKVTLEEDYTRDIATGAGSKVYILSYDDSRKQSEDSDDNTSRSTMLDNCRLLIEELQKKQVKIRMVSGAANGGEGCIYIISNEELSLKIRTLFAMTFRDAVLKKVDINNQDVTSDSSELTLSAEHMMNYMVLILMVYRDLCVEGDDLSEFEDVCDEVIFDEDFLDDIEIEESELDEDEPEEDTISEAASIDELNLSIRAYNCLKRAGISTVGQLKALSDEELLKIRNLGRKSAEEVKNKLKMLKIDTSESVESKIDYAAALEELIGLEDVKAQIKKVEAFAKLSKDMESNTGSSVPMVFNMEFDGNPGTAKTTVARILAGLFHEIGILPSDEIVEVGRAGLIGRYVGETATKVKKVFESAKGKLLFIDEAYSLVDSYKGSYSDEAISTIVQEMENNRKDTIVIFAGYNEQMKEFIATNPGLASRIPFRIEFKDYSEEELFKIVELDAAKRSFKLGDDVYDKVVSICKAAKKSADFGNGRFCRNLVDAAILNYASRVYGRDVDEESAVKDFTLRASDFVAPDGRDDDKKTGTIGFVA